MTDATHNQPLNELSAVFAQLNPQDVEQFYASYQMWALQLRIVEVQAQIQSVSQRLAENQEQLKRIYPSAIALATLARLQANGVNDSDLLDRLLERGEAWLDRTMQHLAYCEKFDFIRDNYTDWCEHALEGAYDWIDSVAEAQVENYSVPTPDEHSTIGTPSDASVNIHVQTTEEMLLQKLMSDDEEALMLAPTLKTPTIAPLSPTKTPVAVEPEIGDPVGATLGSPSHDLQEIIPAEDIPSDDEDAIQISILPTEESVPVEEVPSSEEIQGRSETSVEDISNIPDTSDTTDTSDTSVSSRTPDAATSHQPQESVPSVSETPTLNTDEDDEDHPWTWHALSSSETNIPSSQALQSAKPRRKRSVLRQLVSTIFGGR